VRRLGRVCRSSSICPRGYVGDFCGALAPRPKRCQGPAAGKHRWALASHPSGPGIGPGRVDARMRQTPGPVPSSLLGWPAGPISDLRLWGERFRLVGQEALYTLVEVLGRDRLCFAGRKFARHVCQSPLRRPEHGIARREYGAMRLLGSKYHCQFLDRAAGHRNLLAFGRGVLLTRSAHAAGRLTCRHAAIALRLASKVVRSRVPGAPWRSAP
jgi:hypothetical protein